MVPRASVNDPHPPRVAVRQFMVQRAGRPHYLAPSTPQIRLQVTHGRSPPCSRRLPIGAPPAAANRRSALAPSLGTAEDIQWYGRRRPGGEGSVGAVRRGGPRHLSSLAEATKVVRLAGPTAQTASCVTLELRARLNQMGADSVSARSRRSPTCSTRPPAPTRCLRAGSRCRAAGASRGRDLGQPAPGPRLGRGDQTARRPTDGSGGAREAGRAV